MPKLDKKAKKEAGAQEAHGLIRRLNRSAEEVTVDSDEYDTAYSTMEMLAKSEKAKQAKQVCNRRSELIKYQCETVFEFLDTVFGEGTAKKVFGDSCNLRTALAVYEEVILAINELDNQFNEQAINHFKSGKTNFRKQNGGKIYPNPNYHHKKKKKRR